MSEPVINVDVDEAVVLVAEGAFLLDVREDDEWTAGRAPQAVHVRLSELPDRFAELPVDRPIVCVCRVGGRSARAAEFLAEQGYVARNLSGGMQAWERDGYPLVGDVDVPTVI